ncbi:hypothetical protein HWV62_38757 [Athelia sp. TMB]|nr:hypothetical protein HWV62_38757 [Athelia sp. TMB]
MAHLYPLLITASLAFQALALPATPTRSTDAPIVTLDYATYQGSTDPALKITSFLGVRYAAPPTGFLRFKAPQKPATSSGLQSATTLPAQCWQANRGTNPINPLLPLLPKRAATVATSEDCLFLKSGSTAGGFLSGVEVKAKGALNAGLLDQTLALQWVQKYANGGQTNPPLFRAAITNSAFFPSQYPGNGVIPTTIYNQVANGTGCANATDTFTCLQELPAATLSAVNTNMVNSGFFGTFTFVPVIDGTLIVERPTVTLQKGKHNGNVLLSVTNTFEGAIFVDSSPEVANITQYAQELFPLITPAQQIAVAAEYAKYNATLPTTQTQAIAIMGEGLLHICFYDGNAEPTSVI